MQFEFYKGKRILITGHTGFKGSWMSELLCNLGAEVTGFALESPTDPSLFEMCGIEKRMRSVFGDIRDFDKLYSLFQEARPEIVIHMAAQPLVRESYNNPVYTYDVNVMGTVNVMECIRKTDSVKSFVNVTTDKVYKNHEWEWGYRENEELNGYDPYSNSKSCSELVTDSYKKSFFSDRNIAITTMRAGNVIGGGDFAADRIIPDCIRAVMEDKEIIVRNPYSTRPYQHVLEPVVAYLLIAMEQYQNPSICGNYNVGPDDCNCLKTGELVTMFCEEWSKQSGKEIHWIDQYDGGPHEANFLKLDCSKLKSTLNWKPRWHMKDTMEKIVEWSIVYMQQGDIVECMDKQIGEFINE